MTTNVLLWSPEGAGEHYYGPGAFAYRLYGSAPQGAVRLELAHSSERQLAYPLFAHTHRIEPKPHTPLGLAQFLWRSKRWLKQNAKRFDVLHGMNGFHSSVAPAFFAQRHDLPCVIFVAGHRVEFTDKPGLKRLLGLSRKRRRMIRELSGVIAMSRAIHEELLEVGVDARRIARIPMGVDVQRFRPAADADEVRVLRTAIGIHQDLPVIVFSGSISPRKRPHLLVEALAQLNTQNMPCQLVLAGPVQVESYAQEMKLRATDLGIDSLVHWLGHVQRIEDVLRAADLFALPSSSEGMPAALVEALACGLPSIVTRISGCEDLVENEVNGFFVEPEARDIAAALRHYLREPGLLAQHSAQARLRVVNSCSNEVVLGAYLSLFESVRSGRDPAVASTMG